MDLTVVTCNYNTPDVTLNMLKSLKLVSESLPKIVVMNTSDYSTPESAMTNFRAAEIPHYEFLGGIHGEAVNLALKKVTTRYVLLVDSDIIFLKDWQKPFQAFKDGRYALMGKVVGNVAGKELYERVEPWYCFIDTHFLKYYKINFFDRERTKASKATAKVYDVGSTMFEDVTNAGGLVADVDLDGRYFRHYGGMSWRTQKYNPNQGDTDIDFGGTHPHSILYDIGIKVRQEYDRDVKYLSEVDIKGVYSYE